MDRDLIGVVVFIAFVILSVLGKLRKKPEEDAGAPPADTPSLDELPETLRRMLTGQPPMRKARPAAPKAAPETEGRPAQPVAAPPAQRRTPYQPQVARPAAPRTAIPAPPRPVAQPVQQPRRAAPAPPPVGEEEGPRHRPQHVTVPQSPAPKLPKPLTAQQMALRSAPRPADAPRTPKPVHAAPEQAEAGPTFLKDLHEVRRGIILSELLGPPLALR